MPKYTAAQFPEILLDVKCSNQYRAHFFALQQLVNLTRSGELNSREFAGFSSQSLIEITNKDLMAKNENELTQAVKTICKLSQAKKTVQDTQEEASDARQHIDLLFSNKKLSQNEFKLVEESIEKIKIFSQANLRYKEALPNAIHAKTIIDEALKPPESENGENLIGS